MPNHRLPLLFAYTGAMKVAGHNRVTDWPKLGPSLLIATALVVAIRTARWAAQGAPVARCADPDLALDAEVEFAIRITNRVLQALLQRKSGYFPEKLQAIYEPDDEGVPQ